MNETTAHLLVLPAQGEPHWVPLKGERVSVGTAAEADIRLSDSEVEPAHAELHRRGDAYLVVRKGAALWVNGRRVSAQPLQEGDLISLGRSALSFRERGPVSSADGGAPGQAAEAPEILRRLYALGRRLHGGEPVDRVIDQVLFDVVELTGAHRGMLVIFEGSSAIKRAEARTALAGDFDSADQELSRTAVAKIHEDPRPRLWTDISSDPDLALAPSIHRARVRSLIAAPILVGEDLVGALYLSRSETSALFDHHHLDLLSIYAAQAALLLATASKKQELSDEVEQIRRDLEAVREGRIWGSSRAMQSLLQRVGRVARSTISVLVVGETGTGKELFAREVHRASDRAEGAFVPVNCGAIPAPLLESELFGHIRGAFTDATKDRVGKLRGAAGGTLFLDEIGEMPLEQQAKLLRVLEDREVTPLGGDKAFAADFRLVCATNQNLEQLVDQGRFRQDLYYRVAGFVLTVPPLRERDDDAVELAQLFIKRHAVLLEQTGVRLSASAMTAIRNHRWKGNVRELEAAVRRALVVADEDTIQAADLSLETPKEAIDEILPLAQVRDRHLREYVQRVVERCGGNRTAAAKALMVTPRTIFKYLEEV